MVAYEIFLDDTTSIVLHFDSGQTLELSINHEKTFSFSEVDGRLRISTDGSTYLREGDEEVQSCFCRFERVASDLENIPLTMNLEESCCTINGQEYCVKNGCADTPCGRLCG